MRSGSGNDVAPPGELESIALGIGPELVVRPGGTCAFGFFWWATASWSARSMSSAALEYCLTSVGRWLIACV